MFSIPHTNVIESDAGFSVEVLGRTGLTYKEDGRSMHIDSEVLAGPDGLMVISDSIREWQKPHETLPVSSADKERIISNLRAAFQFRGLDIEVV